MRRPFLAILLCLLFCDVTFAVQQQFPYQATVVTGKVDVRCGPGTRFYVTGHITQGDSVTVHRHDHGGWYMVAPPKGSYSWVNSQYVKAIGGGRGVIQAAPIEGRPARVVVRIGSQVSDEHSFYGRELSNGDEVTILGEETLQTARGRVQMTKIVPPAQEFRWVKGEFLVPVDQSVRIQVASDPYQVPPELRPDYAEKKKQIEVIQTAQVKKEQQQRDAYYDELDGIDRTYAEMMSKEPKAWNLDAVAAQYQQLAATSNATIQSLVDKRLDVINRRREILSHYQKFVQVASESSQRDEQLVAMQLGFESSVPTEMTEQGPSLPAPSAADSSSTASVTPRLNGAGIIQPVASGFGTPAYALVSPEGKLLAYLESADGVGIRKWLGKPSGIIGNRNFDSQLGADVIRVQRIVTVQLVP